MKVLTHLLLCGMSFCLAYYNNKENDKVGVWMWRISGGLWGINVIFDIVKMICQ
jgi:hypothetical protein